MGRMIALALGGITLLVAGAVAGIYFATEPPRGGVERAGPALAAQPQPSAPATQPFAYPAPPPQTVIGNAPPRTEPLPDYTAPAVPLPNAAPPIQTEAVVDLPPDPEDRQAKLLELRRQKFAAQMEALNQRNAARGGQVLPPKPPPPPPSAARSSSRRALRVPVEETSPEATDTP